MKPIFPEHSQFAEQVRKKPIILPATMEEIEHYAEFYRDEVPEYYPLFLFTYLFGTRITESLSTMAKDLTNKTVKPKRKGSDKETDTVSKGVDVLVARVLTLKNRRMPFRTLPAKIMGKERKMCKALWKYRQGLDLDDPLFFDINRKKAYWHFRKLKFGVDAYTLKPRQALKIDNYRMHPHFLRHCRLTHLVLEHDYGIPKLIQFAGWTNPNPAMIYVQMNWKDLMEGMKD